MKKCQICGKDITGSKEDICKSKVCRAVFKQFARPKKEE